MKKTGYIFALIGTTSYMLFAISWFVANIVIDDISFWWIAFSFSLSANAISCLGGIVSAYKENTDPIKKIGGISIYLILAIILHIIMISQNDDVYSIYSFIWVISGVFSFVGLFVLRSGVNKALKSANTDTNNVEPADHSE